MGPWEGTARLVGAYHLNLNGAELPSAHSQVVGSLCGKSGWTGETLQTQSATFMCLCFSPNRNTGPS